VKTEAPVVFAHRVRSDEVGRTGGEVVAEALETVPVE
jgi:hypothetical protein